MIRGAHLASSIIENKYWKGLDRIFRNLLSNELEEDIKAVRLLQIRPQGSSMVKSYGRLKILELMRF